MPDTVQSGVYSFLDFTAAMRGPGGNFSIIGMGFAPEGLRIVKTGDKNSMVIGSDGAGMHSLHASQAGRVSVNLLKVGPGNALLNKLYRYQCQSSAFWGQNQLTAANPVTGDSITCLNGAFVKHPDSVYATEGGFNVWEFDFQNVSIILGNGYNPTGI